jgi:hypothetical protein
LNLERTRISNTERNAGKADTALIKLIAIEHWNWVRAGIDRRTACKQRVGFGDATIVRQQTKHRIGHTNLRAATINQSDCRLNHTQY